MANVVVGMSGASGSVYGLRLLEKLGRRRPKIESHLIVTRPAEKTLYHETGKTLKELQALASYWHSIDEIGATVASGSFLTSGMVIAPCSINTMSAIASGTASNLLTRAADVTLKERRPLVLMVRESPLHLGHLRTMVALAEMGAILAPPMPAFYHRPVTLDDIVNHSVERTLDLLGLSDGEAKRWSGC